MKDTFFHIAEEKQQRIIKVALQEFARSGYEACSLDRIVQRASISKGGLYEYIESKRDLYLFLAETAYDGLYQYIVAGLGDSLPEDIIDRIAAVSAVAVDFYQARPEMIAFIARAGETPDARLKGKVQTVFDQHFDAVFGSANWARVAFGRDRVLALLKWLLVKTRNDFLRTQKVLKDKALCKTAYLQDWEFYLTILRQGIYHT